MPGKRRRGRPKRRWLDNTKNKLSERELIGGGSARPSSLEASHKKHQPHIKVGKDAEEEEDAVILLRLTSYQGVSNTV